MTQFASGTFSGTDGTLLETADASWAKFGGATINITLLGGRGKPASSSTVLYYHSATPPGADYSVSCDLYRVDTFSVLAGPVARATGTATATFYHARYSSGSGAFQLYRYNNGAATIMGASAAVAMNAGDTHTVKLEVNGTQISVYLNGGTTPIIGPITDSSITAAGYGGLRSASPSGYFDNFSADTIGAGGSTYSAAVNEAATLTEVAGAVATLIASLAEDAAAADSSGASAVLLTTQGEPAILADSCGVAQQVAAGMLEAMAAGDVAAALMAAGALQVEAATLMELLTAAKVSALDVLDSLALAAAENAAAPAHIAAGITEAAGLADITGIRGIMITSAQAAEYLDKALGITVPGFILTTAVQRLNSREDALEAAGYDEPTLMLIQCMCVALIAAAGAPRRIASQGAASGASRSFRYTDNDLSALRRSLAELDTARVVADIVGPDPSNSAGLLLIC